MEQISTIGLDIAKQVFQAHCADAFGNVISRKKISRAKVLAFFASHPPCLVAMEACGGAHYWGRQIAKLGHEVRLIPPKYVKPFVKRQKNDATDAEAICEAAQRPTMRFVAVKGELAQAAGLFFEPEIYSCASAPNSSMRCAVIWLNMVGSRPRALPMWRCCQLIEEEEMASSLRTARSIFRLI